MGSAARYKCHMRTVVVCTLVMVGLSGAVVGPAWAQEPDALLDSGGPVSAPPNSAFPPAGSGCGDDGLTQSASRPTLTLTSATLPLRDTGRVRIYIRGTQTAAMTVKMAQVGGRRVGGTNPGGYTCTTSGTSVVAPALNAYGRKLVARHGRLAVKLTFRLVNGSGVRHTRVWSGVIRPAGDVTARTPCPHATAHTTHAEARLVRVYENGGSLFACDRASRRRVRLDYVNCDPDTCYVSRVAVAGRYVAWEWALSGRDEPLQILRVAAVPSGRTVAEELDTPGPATDHVVRATGASAWILDLSTEQGPSYQVLGISAQGTSRRLAQGPDIDPTSLRRQGRSVSWSQGATTHSAALD